jgi:hypothetical protein
MTSLGDAGLSDILHCIPSPAPKSPEKSPLKSLGNASQSGSLGSRRCGRGSSAATATAAALAKNIHQSSRRGIGCPSIGISKPLFMAPSRIVLFTCYTGCTGSPACWWFARHRRMAARRISYSK